MKSLLQTPERNSDVKFETIVTQIVSGKFQGSFKVGNKEIIAVTDADSAEKAYIQAILAVRHYFRNNTDLDIS